MNTLPLAALITVFLIVTGCHTSKKIYLEGNSTDVIIQTTCREPIFIPNLKEAEIKEYSIKSGADASKKVKLKTTDNQEKSTFRLLTTQLVITESCNKASQGAPTIMVYQILKVEKLKTKETVEFRTDTTLIKKQKLTSLAGSTIEPTDIPPLIHGITEKNFSKIASHLK